MPDRVESKSKTEAVANRKTRKVRIRTWLEALLLAAGVVLLALYGASRVDSLLTSRTLLKAMPAVQSSESSMARAGNASLGASLPDDPGATDTAGESIDRGTENLPLAVLRIPKIHLEVPVLDGSDALTLNHAAGRIEGTALPGEPGNIGIAAHRDSFFRDLGKLRVGDSLMLESAKGTEIYIVDGTQIVMPSNVSVLNPRPAPSLTLVTCYPFGYFGNAPQRYIVTATLAQPAHTEPSSASPISR
ncbi:MAG TPA: class D sortase [Acidobacteriaceae bacterium]|jgi:sortase A